MDHAVRDASADFIESLCAEYQKHNQIDPAFYERYRVKRGLRNADGTGVMAGVLLMRQYLHILLFREAPAGHLKYPAHRHIHNFPSCLHSGNYILSALHFWQEPVPLLFTPAYLFSFNSFLNPDTYSLTASTE